MLSLGVLLASAFGQESPESPEYSRWAAFEKGATAEYRQTGEVAGRPVDAQLIYRLGEITPKLVTLREATVRRGCEGWVWVSLAKIQIFAGMSRERTIVGEGEDELQVDGRPLRCRWTETDEGPDLRMKEWVSVEVPGGLVRREVTASGDRPARTVLDLTRWTGSRRAVD